MAFSFLKKQDINSGVEEFRATDGALLLDVRSEGEYQSGHIPGSIHFDMNNASKALSTLQSKDAPLFVYCLSGSRSRMAANALNSMGYTRVTNIGGIGSYAGVIERGN